MCIEPEKFDTDCPIVDIFAVSDTQEASWRDKGYTVTELGYPQDGYSTKIAFSKTQARDSATSEPVISVVITSGTPCYGFDSDKLVIEPEWVNTESYQLEKDKPISQCPPTEFQPNLISKQDDRYNNVGSVSLFLLEDSNGVYEAIEKQAPLWYQSVGSQTF